MIGYALIDCKTGHHYSVDKEYFTFGRGHEADLQLDHPTVSREHCEIYAANDTLILVDNSKSGVRVNGEKISHQRLLAHQDKIRIGPYEFELLLTHEASHQATITGSTSGTESALAKQERSKGSDSSLKSAKHSQNTANTQPKKAIKPPPTNAPDNADKTQILATPADPAHDLALRSSDGHYFLLQTQAAANGITLGRGKSSDLLCDLPSISAQHAGFSYTRGQWYVYDLNSTNGTEINGALCEPGIRQRIKPNDVITLGEQTFTALTIGGEPPVRTSLLTWVTIAGVSLMTVALISLLIINLRQ